VAAVQAPSAASGASLCSVIQEIRRALHGRDLARLLGFDLGVHARLARARIARKFLRCAKVRGGGVAVLAGRPELLALLEHRLDDQGVEPLLLVGALERRRRLEAPRHTSMFE